MYDKHLSASASDPVNVDSQARQRAQESLADPKPTCFEIAQTQIFRLMKTDSYPRFLKSDVYKDSVVAEMEGKPLPFTGLPEPQKPKEEVKKVNSHTILPFAQFLGAQHLTVIPLSILTQFLLLQQYVAHCKQSIGVGN